MWIGFGVIVAVLVAVFFINGTPAEDAAGRLNKNAVKYDAGVKGNDSMKSKVGSVEVKHVGDNKGGDDMEIDPEYQGYLDLLSECREDKNRDGLSDSPMYLGASVDECESLVQADLDESKKGDCRRQCANGDVKDCLDEQGSTVSGVNACAAVQEACMNQCMGS